MAGRTWVHNTFPSLSSNSELRVDQLSLILENRFLLQWILDLNQLVTSHFLFQYNHMFTKVPIWYLIV